MVPQKGVHVPRTRPPYPPEFKAEAVKLARSSEKPLSELARDLGVSTETLRNWLKQQQTDAGKRDGATTDEREELRRLRKENKVLKEEREVLRKATAFFAREENNTRRRR
jgi:transposase